jgi:hypothetical protein
MQIDIHGNIEKFIQSQLAAGNYRSVEELLEEMAAIWKASQRPAANGSPLPVMQERLDVARLAAHQGVGPCEDLRDLQGAGWPAADSIEEFDNFLRELRGSGIAGDRG